MFKSIGIVAFGGAIGVPIWGVVAVGVVVLGAGVGVGVFGAKSAVAIAALII